MLLCLTMNIGALTSFLHEAAKTVDPCVQVAVQLKHGEVDRHNNRTQQGLKKLDERCIFLPYVLSTHIDRKY
jgi:hypothetical protein